MTAAAVLERVRAAGLSVEADGGDLVVRPSGRISPELRAQLLSAKPEILALLRTSAGPYVADTRRCAGCGRSGFVVMVVTGCRDHLCRRCWTYTTTIPVGHQPATPGLDAAIARANAAADRERR